MIYSIWALLVIVLVGLGGSIAAPPPDCTQAFTEGAPTRLTTLCTLHQFVEGLIIEENMNTQGNPSPRYLNYNNNVKRQEPEHVFLRFGRRR